MADEGYRFLAVPVSDAKDFVKDKEKSCAEFATYFLLRIMKMFKYDGLPEEIPQDCLHKMLLQDGYGWFTTWKSNELDEKFFFFHGNMGGTIDAYYRPTKFIVANPGANCFEQFDINRQKNGTYYGDKGVIIRNDTLYHGVMPLIKRYAYLLAENVLTMHSADVFLRIIALISAQDDKTLFSANEFIKSIEDGKMCAVAESKFFDGVKMQSPPSNNGSYLTQFIEYQQYFLGSFFNELGLNANFNMKRESIAKSESSLNEDSMLPLCQNMLKCRQEDFDVVNEMFGLNVKVSFDSAWLQNALEILFELESLKRESTMSTMSNGLGGGNFDKAVVKDQNEEKSESENNNNERESSEGSSGEEEKDEREKECDLNEELTKEKVMRSSEDDSIIDNLIKQAAGFDGVLTDDVKEGDNKNESDQ